MKTFKLIIYILIIMIYLLKLIDKSFFLMNGILILLVILLISI